MYQTRYPPQQQYFYHTDMMLGPSAPHVPVLDDDWMMRSSGLVSQYHRHQLRPLRMPPPEPTPFGTDIPSMPQRQSTELADFASSIIYLMWRARRPSIMLIHRATIMPIDNIVTSQNYIPVHEDLAAWNGIASPANIGFRKYCRQLLDATRLSESVVLLALKLIAKLLQRHPRIHGAEGSEYRLFTVALMLGSKYLDDNTFTNTTWSHLSGMTRAELQTMEFEFLDVVDFRLCVNKYEYQSWKEKLFAFHDKVKATCQAQSWEKMMHITTTTDGYTSNITPSKAPVAQACVNDHQTPLLYRDGTPQFPHEISNILLTRVPLRASVRSSPSPQQPFSQIDSRFPYQFAHPQKSQTYAERSCVRQLQTSTQHMTAGYSQHISPCIDRYHHSYTDLTSRVQAEPRQQYIDRQTATSIIPSITSASMVHDQTLWQSLPAQSSSKQYVSATAMRVHHSMYDFPNTYHHGSAFRLPPLSITPESLLYTTSQVINSSESIPPISDELNGWSTQQRISVESGSSNINRVGSSYSLPLACYEFPPANDGGAPLRQLYNAPDIFHLQR